MPRPERPLGRGLEDISDLFLSYRAHNAAPVDQAPGRQPERTHIQAGVPREVQPEVPGAHRTVILRRQPRPARDRLAAVVMDFAGELEDGLRGIDARVQCEGCGEIDVVAVDRMNQLVLVDFEPAADDGLLLRGMGHYDWVVRNTANLRRMYRGHVVDFSAQPRLFLIAPRFSSLVKQVARHIASPQISWKRYIAVDLTEGTGFLFEDVEGE